MGRLVECLVSLLIDCCYTVIVSVHHFVSFFPVPDAPPLYITYSSPTSTTILLHWGPVPPQFKNGIIRGFKIEHQENQPNATLQVRERFLVNWALLGELKKFTEYYVRVRAFTSLGYGPENNITVLTSQDGMKLLCVFCCIEYGNHNDE